MALPPSGRLQSSAWKPGMCSATGAPSSEKWLGPTMMNCGSHSAKAVGRLPLNSVDSTADILQIPSY